MVFLEINAESPCLCHHLVSAITLSLPSPCLCHHLVSLLTMSAKRAAQAATGKRKGIIFKEYTEDARGRVKVSKTTPRPRPIVNSTVDADNRFTRDNTVEEIQNEPVPAEPEYNGVEMDWDSLGLDDEVLPGQKRVRFA
jgi:hypothetical protein